MIFLTSNILTMKTISQLLISLLLVFVLTSTVIGQVNQTRLNQCDLLLKQQVGLWQTNPKKDTVSYADSRPFGKGIVETDWIEVKGKIVAEYYVIFGFKENSLDTIFIYTLDKSTGLITTTKQYFITQTKAVQETLSTNNILFPTQKMIGEYYPSDSASVTLINKNGEFGKTIHYYRVKRIPKHLTY
jgi:hypothetical protein